MKALRLAAILAILAAPSASAEIPLSFHSPAQFSGSSEAIGLEWALLVFTGGETEARLEGLQAATATNRTVLVAHFSLNGTAIGALPLASPPSQQQKLPSPFGAILRSTVRKNYIYIEARSLNLTQENALGQLITMDWGDRTSLPIASNYPYDSRAIETDNVGLGFKTADGRDSIDFRLEASGVKSLRWSGIQVSCLQPGACPDGAIPINRSVDLGGGSWIGQASLSRMDVEGFGGRLTASGHAFAIAAGSTKADLAVNGVLRLPQAQEAGECSPCLGSANRTLKVEGNVSLLGLSPAEGSDRLQGTLTGAGEVRLDETSLGAMLLGGATTLAGVGAAVALGLALLKAFLAFFTRHLGDPRDHPNGKRVFEAVRANPGPTYRAIVAQTGLSDSTVRHHLERLARSGHLVGRRSGNRVHWFENHGRYDKDWSAVAALRDPGLRAVEEAVAARPGISQKAILEQAQALGQKRSTVQGRLHRLLKWGLLKRRPDGRGWRYWTRRDEG